MDTGVAVSPHPDTELKTMTRSSSVDLLMSLHNERPAAVGASAVEGLAKELRECLPWTHIRVQCPSGRWDSDAAGQNASNGGNRTIADMLSARTNGEELVDEFFI